MSNADPLTINPSGRFAVGGRVHSLHSTDDGRLAIASFGGHVLILDPELNQEQRYRIANESRIAAVSGDGRLIALTNGSTLLITLLDGSKVHEELLNNGTGIDGCLFSADSSVLWTVSHVEDGRVELQIRDTHSWQIVRRAVIDEPAPPTYFALTAHPKNKIIVVWAAAGQDGQWVYWAHDDVSSIRVTGADELIETTPPQFHPGGSEFLVIRNRSLERWAFSDCIRLGALTEIDLSDDDIGDFACYISDLNALVGSRNGRIYQVDLESMAVVREIHMRGHEPRPCRELYPILDNEHHPCTGLQWFQRVGTDRIVTVHCELPAEYSTEADWKDVVTVWSRFLDLGEFRRVEVTGP